ncbi:MAG: AMP-binding protein [Legionella sp.]|nr:AMP-binding protein [Legionella sp.]
MYELVEANFAEQLIWRRLLENPYDKSCTLSYRFLIKQILTSEQINAGIYRFLNAHKELNYRFYEHDGRVYKRFQPPSIDPARELSERCEKVLFNKPLTPLYEFQWQKTDDGIYLYVYLSHLIIDGSGFWLLVNEMEAAFLDKQNPIHKEQPQKHSEDDSYWQHYLHNQSLHQVIPFLDHVKTPQWVSHESLLSSERARALINYKNSHSVSLFHLLSAALASTLHQYLKDESSATIIRLAYYVKLNRQLNQFGCDINLLPLFVPCEDTQTLEQVLQSVVATRKKQVSVQNRPILELLKYVDSIKNNNRPLLNVVVNESPGLIAQTTTPFFNEVRGLDNQSASNTLSLVYTFDGEQLRIRFESNQGPLLQELLGQLAVNCIKILELMITKPQTLLADVVLREQAQPISKGAQYDSQWPLFLVQQNQERTAVIDETNTLSYLELHKRINAVYKTLAALDKDLLTQGVALFLTRSCQLPIAMLSALAAKVTFIPIAENTSAAARGLLIKETQLKTIFVDNQTEQLLTAEERAIQQVINLDLIKGVDGQLSLEPLLDNEIAYILFTSGSTGKPKGVMISYDNLSHFFSSMAAHPGLTQHDTLLALTAISFDISINELLLPLFCGGCVLIASNAVRLSHQALGEMVNQYDVSVVQATPSTLNLLMQSKWAWHNKRTLRLWVGGEVLSADLVRFFKHQNIEIYNMYGPTEATIWVSASLVHSADLISIGTPLANTSLYVLDSNGASMPLGMVGELVIEGKLVGQGYINYPATSFKHGDIGVRRYHTGDKVIALAKDIIIYLKRYDEQVKVRGHRVELEEINTQIRKLIPSFIGLTLLVPEPEAHLCVYYTSPTHLNVRQLKEALKKILPEYKVPQRYYLLETMPLTNNGKLDKNKLIGYKPQPQPATPIDDKEPTSFEQKILRLITQHFNVIISDPERSLLDYGFNSLSFNQLSFLCGQYLEFSVSPHQFYQLNTIKTLSEYYQFNKIAVAKDYSPIAFKNRRTPIAVIGYDALLPGGKNPAEFWQSLVKQECLISDHQRPWLSSRDRAGYINKVEYFDRKFFNLSPIEVMHLDFRQRLLLQCAFRTLEHASILSAALDHKAVACFIAATGMDSMLASSKQQIPAHPYTLSGNSLSMLANRLSFYFNWKGPSATVDTACSGSLTALARAIDSLILGKADLCFVGSANLILDNDFTDALQAGRFLSPQYRCASFLDQADGYVRGEGVMGFLLKPLEQAEKDGDVIHAVIHHVVENHGGRSASLTSPNQQAQADLLVRAYPKELAQDLSYIETHGTGTKLGDPIEIDALKEFEQLSLGDNQHETIYLGALKQNIGHLEASAGFASLLKIILAMKHQCLPANVQSQSINPLINLASSKFKLSAETIPWGAKKLMAGVSSFGFGGSNAHVVLSNYDAVELHRDLDPDVPLPIVLSAKTKSALRARINNLLNDLASDLSLIDIAYSLAVGRTHFECRTVVLAQSKQQLVEELKELLATEQLQKPIEGYSAVLDDYLAGNPVNWESLFSSFKAKRVALSPYIFDTEPYVHKTFASSTNLIDSIKFTSINANHYSIIIASDHPFLEQHRVFNHKVLPGVAYVDFILSCLSKQKSKKALCLENLRWLRPAVCTGESLSLNLDLGMNAFKFSNLDNQLLATGEYSWLEKESVFTQNWFKEAQSKLKKLALNKSLAAYVYNRFKQLGIDYGTYFQGISSISCYENLALTQILIEPQGSCIGLLDAAFQSGMAINLAEIQAGLMPFSLGRMIILDPNKLRLIQKSHVYTLKNSPFRTNFVICDEHDNPLCILIDLGVKASNLSLS